MIKLIQFLFNSQLTTENKWLTNGNRNHRHACREWSRQSRAVIILMEGWGPHQYQGGSRHVSRRHSWRTGSHQDDNARQFRGGPNVN